jgi:hypothetical protein
MKKVSIFVISLWISPSVFSQTSFNASSHTAVINGQTFEYSIGEMSLISTEKSNNLIVTQGYLQPHRNDGSNSNQASTGFDNLVQLVKVYPVPTNNVLNIEMIETLSGDFNFQLLDAAGKMISSKNEAQTINNQKWTMDLSALASGNYFLMLQQKDATGKEQQASFKIQKTN